MKAAVYYKNDDIRVEEINDLDVGYGEIKVKIKSCGICGSDVMEWYRIKRSGKPGGIGAFGHECTGDIVEIGPGVDPKWKIGDRVVVTHHVPDNTCPTCIYGHTTACHHHHTMKFKNGYGAYAEYVVLPLPDADRGILKLPDIVSYDEGTFVEPLGCVIRGQRISKVRDSKSVLIIGAGIAGILHTQAAISNGAGLVVVSDVLDYRLELAKKFGANYVINAEKENVPKRFKELNDNRGADVVIMTVPLSICIQQSLESISPGGIILFFTSTRPGVKSEIDIWDLWQNEVTITHSYSADFRDLYCALKWIEYKRINVKDMITHHFPLEKTSEGFMLTANPKEGSLKVIIHIN